MVSRERMNVVLLGIIVVLLAMLLFDRGSSRFALAQSSSGSAAGLVGMVGMVEDRHQPLYLIDTREQVILVYEYIIPNGGLQLCAARTYKYDKSIEMMNQAERVEVTNPSVDDIKGNVRKRKRR